MSSRASPVEYYAVTGFDLLQEIKTGSRPPLAAIHPTEPGPPLALALTEVLSTEKPGPPRLPLAALRPTEPGPPLALALALRYAVCLSTEEPEQSGRGLAAIHPTEPG